MLNDVWRELKRVLQPQTARVNVQEHRIELLSGGTVDMWSLDSADSVRGRKYKRVVIDEAAMVRDLENAWQAVIRPTLTDFQGDAWFPSTPKGMGFFKRLYDMGQDKNEPEWASWQIPTSENTSIPHLIEELKAAKNELPERIFNQEYLAQFLDDAGGVFRKVMESAIAGEQEEAIPGHEYVIGIDWGRDVDFTVFTVLDVTTKEAVKVDRSNKVDYILQRGRLGVLCDAFKTKTILPEQNSIGVPNIEMLQREGFKVHPFITSNASKAEAVDALALAFERKEIRIVNDKNLISELLAYEAERLPSGMLRYSAPPGYHDDCVMSLAIAWQAVASPPKRLLAV
jgi:hypothetical protein